MANLNLTNSFNQMNNSFSIAAVNNGNALPSFTNSFILEPSSVAAAAAAAAVASSSSSSSSAFNTISLNSFQNGNNHLLSPGPSNGGLKSKQNTTSQQQRGGMTASNTSPSASNQNLNLIGTNATSSHHKNPNRNKKVKDLIQDLQHNCNSNNGGLTMSAQHQAQQQQHGLYSDYQGGGYQQYSAGNSGNYSTGNQFYKTPDANTSVSIFHGLDSSNNSNRH